MLACDSSALQVFCCAVWTNEDLDTKASIKTVVVRFTNTTGYTKKQTAYKKQTASWSILHNVRALLAIILCVQRLRFWGILGSGRTPQSLPSIMSHCYRLRLIKNVIALTTYTCRYIINKMQICSKDRRPGNFSRILISDLSSPISTIRCAGPYPAQEVCLRKVHLHLFPQRSLSARIRGGPVRQAALLA